MSRASCPECRGPVARVDEADDPIETYRCEDDACRSVSTTPEWRRTQYDHGQTGGRPGGGRRFEDWAGPLAGIDLDGPDSQFLITEDGDGRMECRDCGSVVLGSNTDLHEC